MNTVCIGLKLLLDEVNIVLTDLQRELERRRVEPEQQLEMVTIEELPPMPEVSINDNASSAGESKADSDENPMVPSSAKIVTDLAAKIDFWYQLIREVEESSVNAVSILNELLSYDKIEQKTMTIEKELLPVWEVIDNAIKPLSIQARYSYTYLPTYFRI
jgi:signal transduction histidine kinase